MDVSISLSPKKLGLAAFRMLTGKGAGYERTGDMNVKTPFGPMNLPVKRIGKTVFRR